MSRTLTLKKLLKHFNADQNGTIAVMAALAAVPMLLATGAAVDFVRFNAAQTHVQAALDAATISGAAAKKVSVAKRVEIAELSFKHNITTGAADGMANTHIALGIEFGYHMLSPEAPFTLGVS